MRVKATISYDGSKFIGFQRQKNSNKTIAQTIEIALSTIGINEKIVGSGRTDRGVHASNQVIHFNLPAFWKEKSLQELKQRVNNKLKYIQFKHIIQVDNSFHAQYSAKTRVYRYLIKTTTPKVFELDYVSYYNITNINLFKNALNIYTGRHNFKYFKKSGSITSNDIREVFKIELKRVKNYIAIYIYANGFLRSQVRMMIEGAILTQNNKLTLSELKEQVDTTKKYFTTLAKPEGLYLHRVYY